MPRRHASRAALLLAIASISYILVYYSYRSRNYVILEELPNASYIGNTAVPDVQHVILEWTTFFGENNYVRLGEDCPYQKCVVTNNKSLVNEASVLVFHFSDIWQGYPTFRTQEQIWLLFALESPQSTTSWSEFDGIFNWTGTYRTDSDIWTPYGHVMKLETQSNQLKNYTKGKTKMAAWFNSNCHTSGGRELFANELSKYIDVDIYGSCGELSCLPKMSRECYEQIAREYYFYLSFENSVCKDYVTEKFFHILDYDIVPVVFGGANYSSIGPPGSYIDALAFENPKALAEFLQAVSRNETLYNSYFNWRNTHVKGGYHWVCELCRRLTFRQNETKHYFVSKTYTDMQKWWRDDAKCTHWSE